jgi:tripartite-type tricarboxylate transporter receptor subunit TctC
MKATTLKTANTVACVIAAVFSFAAPLAALAQTFPAKPITLICPWPPGGSTDTHMRQYAQIASKYVGQSIVIENRPGASGLLGPTTMAKTAQPDGYTLAQMPVSAFRVPHIQKVEWDPIKDFTYIIGITGYTFGVVVKSDSQIKTLKDLIDYAKANPGKLSYGSTGNGTSPHLLMEELGMKAGVQFLHVPFKGNADSTQALMGGHVMAQSDATGWGRHVDAGAFRLLVTFGEKRTKWNAPTAKELGIDIVSYSPYGWVGPKGMDPKVVRFLHDAFRKALDDPEHMKSLAQFDQVYWYKSSEDYAKWAADTLKAERATIERVGLLLKQ